MEVKISPDDFDPFEQGLEQVFNILHDVLEETRSKSIQGGCYMFNHHFSPFLENLGLVNSFLNARKAFEERCKHPFELIIHISTQKGDFPLERRYNQVFGDELRSSSIVRANSLVIHPPEDPSDVSGELVGLLSSRAFIEPLSRTSITLSIENGLHGEFFGSLNNMLNLFHDLSDKLNESGNKTLIPRFKFCLDTGHLLLWRYHQAKGTSHADKEIDRVLPEYVKNTSVYHVKTCNSGKEYIVPHAKEEEIFKEHSNKVIDWLEISKKIETPYPKLFCMEIPKRNFILNEIIEFGRNFM
ncbi:MAG: hypothetical protein ACFFCS_18270 [Candidatus Hodarchaeota archaeon]